VPTIETTTAVSQFRIYSQRLVDWLNTTGLTFDGFPLRAVFASPEKAFGDVADIVAETASPAEAERWKKQPLAAISVQYLGHAFDPSRNRGYNTFIRNAGWGDGGQGSAFKVRHPRPVNLRYQIDAFFVYQEHRMLFVEWLEGQQAADRVFLDLDFTPLWEGWGLKTVPLLVEGATDNSDLEVGESAERLIRITISGTFQGWYFYDPELVGTVQAVQVDVRLAPAGVDIQAIPDDKLDDPPLEPDDPEFEVDSDGVMTAQE
jgi:hypothetical protein